MPEEIERGPRIGVLGGARAVRPALTIEVPLSAEEQAKYLALMGPLPAAPFPPGEQPRALVIEGDPALRRLYAQVLKQWELELAEAIDGAAGLKALAGGRADLLVLDLRLADHDGFEVIRGARSYLKLRDTVIVVVSSLEDPKDETAALNLGADIFYRKPLPLELLEARLKPVVRRLYDRPR